MSHKLQPEQWVENYSDKLYAFTKARVQSDETARDIVQDTFLSAWGSKDSYRGEASEKSWLYTICRNKITDHYRKSVRSLKEAGLEDYGSEYFNEQGNWKATAVPKAWAVDSSTTAVETKEFYKVLNECKNRLKELQKAVFVMKYLDDMDSDEICKELQITPSNYWVLMHRAKLQLRECLEHNWFS